jgi:hypothetical protein
VVPSPARRPLCRGAGQRAPARLGLEEVLAAAQVGVQVVLAVLRVLVLVPVVLVGVGGAVLGVVLQCGSNEKRPRERGPITKPGSSAILKEAFTKPTTRTMTMTVVAVAATTRTLVTVVGARSRGAEEVRTAVGGLHGGPLPLPPRLTPNRCGKETPPRLLK